MKHIAYTFLFFLFIILSLAGSLLLVGPHKPTDNELLGVIMIICLVGFIGIIAAVLSLKEK